MIQLNDQQLDFLEQEIQNRGITHPDLAASLLDHFACGIEASMGEGLGFHEAYHRVYMQVSPNGLEEIDHSMSLMIIHQKYSIMKKFVFLLGFLSAFLFVIGFTFKNLHYPTADIQIIIGSVTFSLAFLPAYFWIKYMSDKEAGRNKPILGYVVNLALVMLLSLAIPMKQFDFPGAGELFVTCQLLLAFVLFPKVFLGWYRKFDARPGSPA